MRLFRKRNRNKAVPAEWLVKSSGWLDIQQRKLADMLSRRTQYWSKSSWIIVLALFILLFGGSCLFLIIHVFIKH